MKTELYQTNTSLPGRTRDQIDRCKVCLNEKTRAPIVRAAIDFFLGLPLSKQRYWLDKVKQEQE